MGFDVDITKERIRVFFDKKKVQKKGDRFSPLNLLRRHKNICLHRKVKATWPGAMTILSGIDMLGYCYRGGNLDKSKSRFVDFYINFFFQEEIDLRRKGIDAVNLYKARCAMMHTYGLYHEDYDDNGKIKKVYYFTFTIFDEVNPLIFQIPNSDKYVISITALDKEFEKAMKNYQILLIKTLKTKPNDEIITHFNEAYEKLKLIGDFT